MSKNRTMICCVTFETAKIVEPIIFYNPESVHLIHFVKDDSPDNMIYQDFYDEVCKLVKKWKDIRIIEHIEKVYDYHTMLRTIFGIMQSEKDDPILINISAGTSEYAAAAMMASTMNDNAVPFTVGTSKYTIPAESLKDLYFRDGRAIGLSETVYGPREVATFTMESPDMELIACLHIIKRSIEERVSGKSGVQIQLLKDEGIWSYKQDETRNKTEAKQKELMFYKRHYLQRLLNNGWIVKDPDIRRYVPTDEGSIILTVFGPEDDHDGI